MAAVSGFVVHMHPAYCPSCTPPPLSGLSRGALLNANLHCRPLTRQCKPTRRSKRPDSSPRARPHQPLAPNPSQACFLDAAAVQGAPCSLGRITKSRHCIFVRLNRHCILSYPGSFASNARKHASSCCTAIAWFAPP